MEPRMAVARALLSVSDKSGIVEFARGLSALGIELLSTGGTAALLAREGVKVTQVQDFSGAAEMLGGRVKTLHPKVHGGILARRELASDQADMKAQGILPIDLVVVNLYPFREAVAKGLPFDEVIENIDIGRPAPSRTPPRTMPPSAAGSRSSWRRRTRRRPAGSASRRRSRNTGSSRRSGTARTRTRGRPSTRPCLRPRNPRWQWRGRSRARSSPTTTCSTARRRWRR